MADLNAIDIVDNFKDVLVDYVNDDISWGTDVHPSNSLDEWWGGDTDGISVSLNRNQLTLSVPTATPIIAIGVLKDIVRDLSVIRKTKVIIYLSGKNGATSTKYNSTAVAYRADSLAGDYFFERDLGLLDPGGFMAGKEATWDSVEEFVLELKDIYYAHCRSSYQTVTNTICHSNCHSNCHGSRGRR